MRPIYPFLVVCVIAASHSVAQPPNPSPQAYIRFIGDAVGTCPLVLDNGRMKLQLQRATVAEVMNEVRFCLDRSKAHAESMYRQNVLALDSSIPPQCLDAAKAIRGDAIAHWETYLADPAEGMQTTISRVRGEAGRIRAQAVKARLACE